MEKVEIHFLTTGNMVQIVLVMAVVIVMRKTMAIEAKSLYFSEFVPSNLISPSSGESWFNISFSNVLFPVPFVPTIHIKSPASTSKLNLCSMLLSG